MLDYLPVWELSLEYDSTFSLELPLTHWPICSVCFDQKLPFHKYWATFLECIWQLFSFCMFSDIERGLWVKENEENGFGLGLWVGKGNSKNCLWIMWDSLDSKLKSILTNIWKIRLEQQLLLIEPHKFDILYHCTYSFQTRL